MSNATHTGFAGQLLGEFVARTTWEDIPDTLRHQACRSLINYFACALAVARDPTVGAAINVLRPFSGDAHCTLIGRREQLDAMAGAFVNAVAANLLDFDDTHLATVIHPTAPVAAPVLALAQRDHRCGADALLAFIVGAEIECRIGCALSPGHYDRGWHITATCGVFGAAAAVCKLLGLSARKTWHALGIAASQSSGVVENLPSAAKNVGVGNAARNGLLAGLLAQEGCVASPAAIEGPLGFASAAGDIANLDAMLGQLGERWEFAANTYKPYPCGIVMHAVIDACLSLREQHGLRIDDIESVLVSGDALLLARGDRDVRNAADARVSIHHCAAVALALGHVGVGEFEDECVNNPDIQRFRDRVSAKALSELPRGSARVRVQTYSGESFETTVVHAKGSIEQPLSDDELNNKLTDLAQLGGSDCDAQRLIATLWKIFDQRDVADVMAIARSG